MSNSPEPGAKREPEQEKDNSRTESMEDENIQTFPVETLAEEKPTNLEDVTGVNSHFSAMETGRLENHYSFENREDSSEFAADSASGGNFSGQDLDVGESGVGLGKYGGTDTQLNGGDAYDGEQGESEHAEDRNGLLQNLQPSDMIYDGHSGNSGVGDGASFGSKFKNLAREDQAGYDNRGNENTNALGENGRVASHYSSAPVRQMFDGSRVPEPDDSQIVDTREGADNIPGVDDLPIFANDQSKALNDEIKRREGLVSQVNSTLVDNRERVRIMEEHLKNVRQEVDNTNALVAAKKKEIATEEHLCALATRDASRYAREARRFVVEKEEAQDKLNAVQNAIFSANEGMDRFKLQMNWNQEELEQWALAAKQKEEDNLALQKYTRADDVKIKELSLQIERLSKSVVAKRADLQNLEAESSAKQVELDNTAEEFRRLHAERQDLVRQWQDAVDGMHRRDDEMNVIGGKYARARQLRAERMETLSQNVARLKMQIDDNEEVKGTIEKLERVVQRRREESQAAQKRLEEFRDVLEVVKNTLANGAGALARKRAETANLTAQIEEKRANLEAARKKYQASKRRVEAETNNANKVEATAKSAEENLQQREGELRAANKRLNMAKEAMFKDSQKLYVLRQEEANLIAEICGAQATMKSLQTKVRGLDQEQTRQQELVYTAEFQIQHMERKVARGMGERTDDEKTALNRKIRELEGEMESSRENKKMLTAQARKLNNELRASLRRKENAESQQSELKESINELEVECKVAEADVRREAQTKEEMMVSNDIIRLKMKRLRDTLNGTADEVFSLENRRQQLTMSMTERKAEIQVHWDLQRATLRAAEEERHRVQIELCDRRLAVEKLRARYETLAKGFAGAGGTTGEGGGGDGSRSCSQAYFVIAAAQRREELQREGDELDQEIRRCEREVRALESTLRHLNARNVDFRISFQRADPGCRDAESLRKLEARAKAAQDGLFRRKKELQRAQTDHEEDLARLEGARARTARLGDQNAQLEAVKAQAEAQLQAQHEVLAKEQVRLDRQRACHRAGNSSSSDGENDDKPKRADAQATVEGVATAESSVRETLTEKALRASTLRDTASGVLYTLGQLSREFPEMHEALNFALKTRRLKIPPAPPAHGPSRIARGIDPGRSRSSSSSSSSSRGSADGGSRAGSGQSRRGAESARSSRSGGCSDGPGQGGCLGDRRGSRTGATNGSGISPMRVFEAPL